MTAQSNSTVAINDGMNGYQRRRLETRRVLMDAGKALFVERGVEQVSIDAITSKAGVAKGSFYNHFESREALFEALIEATLAQLLEKRPQISSDITDPLEQGLARTWFSLYTLLSDLSACRLLLQVGQVGAYGAIDKILRVVLGEDLLHGVAQGSLAHIDRDLVLSAYFGVVTRTIGNLLTREDKIDPEDAADQLTELCFAVMGLPHHAPPHFGEAAQ
ncbi:MAG: TetR/AcrR family transcriptional regulator [Halioglobus sp.]